MDESTQGEGAPARPARRRRRWVAAGIALLLIGGVAGVTVAAVLGGDSRRGASATTAPTAAAPSVAAGDSPGADDVLLCQGFEVPAQALIDPTPATELSAEVQAVLTGPLSLLSGPLSEWLVVLESPDQVVVMRELETPVDLGGGEVLTYDLIAIRAATEHAIPLDPPWGVDAATSCVPRHPLESLTQVPITLDPDAPPQPGDTTVRLLVTEHDCNSGEPATGRVEVVSRVETETAVEVVLGVQPNNGGTCPSNPPTPFAIDLEQPLGDRLIVDAAVVPAREIALP